MYYPFYDKIQCTIDSAPKGFQLTVEILENTPTHKYYQYSNATEVITALKDLINSNPPGTLLSSYFVIYYAICRTI
jgi:hypothetical protein